MDGNEVLHEESGSTVVVSGPLVWGADRAIADWVAEKLDCANSWVSYRSIGVLSRDSSQLIAGVVYHGYTGSDVIQSIAATSPMWARPEVIRGLLAYPFETLKCRRTTALISESNTRSWKTMQRIGFQQEGRMRQGGDNGEDLLVFGLTRDECRWIDG